MLEWVAISFSRGSSWPRIEPVPPALASGFFTTELCGKPKLKIKVRKIKRLTRNLSPQLAWQYFWIKFLIIFTELPSVLMYKTKATWELTSKEDWQKIQEDEYIFLISFPLFLSVTSKKASITNFQIISREHYRTGPWPIDLRFAWGNGRILLNHQPILKWFNK